MSEIKLDENFYRKKPNYIQLDTDIIARNLGYRKGLLIGVSIGVILMFALVKLYPFIERYL